MTTSYGKIATILSYFTKEFEASLQEITWLKRIMRCMVYTFDDNEIKK